MIYPAIPTRLHMLSHISLVDYEGVGRRFEVLVLVGGRGRRPVLLHSPTSPPLRHLVQVVPLYPLFHVRAERPERGLFLFTSVHFEELERGKYNTLVRNLSI